MNKSVLIIGGSGILSSAVVDKCIEKGYDVTMINRGNNKLYTNSNAKIIIWDAEQDRIINKYSANKPRGGMWRIRIQIQRKIYIIVVNITCHFIKIIN